VTTIERTAEEPVTNQGGSDLVHLREDVLRAPHARTSLLQWVLVLCSYVPLAALARWPVWTHWSSQLNGCNCWDQLSIEWFVNWTPAAIVHGTPVLATNYIDAPGGINLMWNTSMPALGVLASPFTETIGVVHTVALLLTASLALSASTMFLVLRRWTSWLPAAWLGGLVYGFSTFVIEEGAQGRLPFVFAAIPPLLVLVADKLARREWSALRAGLCLGGLMAFQLLISEEILAISCLMLLAGFAYLAVTCWSELSQRIAQFLRAGSAAAAAFLVVTAYPLLVQFTGPARLTGPPQTPTNLALFSSDLLSPITPGTTQWLSNGWTDRISRTFTAGLGLELTEYVGVSLLIFVVATVVILRRRTIVRLFAVTAVLSFLLSMGPRILVDNHKTSIPGLDALLVHVPILRDIIPAKFGLPFWLSLAVLFGVGIDAFRDWASFQVESASQRSGPADEHVHRARIDYRRLRTRTRWTAGILSFLMGLVVLLPLVPNWPYREIPARVPGYFTSGGERSIEPGSLVATYPYPLPFSAQPMLWQAAAAMRFRILGGYVIAPDKNGNGTFEGDLNPIESCLSEIYATESAPAALCRAGVLRQVFRTLDVTTVIAADHVRNVDVARRVLTDALGTSPRRLDGVSVWQCHRLVHEARCTWS
jgi:hypothetical protein